MKKPKVYIATGIPKEVESFIAEFCDYEKWESEEEVPRDELLYRVADKDGILQTGIVIDQELLNHAPKLKVVSNISVGYNNLDLAAMKARNIIGTNTPYILDNTVVDLIFGLILCASRRISELDKYVKDGKWNSGKAGDDRPLFGVDVHHATLGIIGMGRIGEVLAKRAKFGFDMDVLYYNRNRKLDFEENLSVQYSDFKSLLQKSDFIVAMTPLTKDTFHLIDTEEFSLMKKTAIFINASRGQIVNEKALIEALENKTILGAGLDVYEIEPVSLDNPLLKMSNVITVPHIGSATKKTRFDMAMAAAQSLVTALSGEIPSSIIPELK